MCRSVRQTFHSIPPLPTQLSAEPTGISGLQTCTFTFHHDLTFSNIYSRPIRSIISSLINQSNPWPPVSLCSKSSIQQQRLASPIVHYWTYYISRNMTHINRKQINHCSNQLINPSINATQTYNNHPYTYSFVLLYLLHCLRHNMGLILIENRLIQNRSIIQTG